MKQAHLHSLLKSRGRKWSAYSVAGFLVLAVIITLIQNELIVKQLMRETPDAAIGNPKLMEFAEKRGAPLFRTYCASCHEDDGKGSPILGAPNLTDRDWLYGTGRVSDIEKVVSYGIRSHNPRGWNLAVMPAFARAVPSVTERIPPMTPGESRAVIAYLLELEKRSADGTLAAAGDKIFHGTGGCYDCHSADAKGDSAIGAPDLTDRIWLYGDGSPAAMFESIAYGRQGICPAWIGKLSPSAIREISIFVYSLSQNAGQEK
jgi:cytochrome c oxidase cbb3-type subunit 3